MIERLDLSGRPSIFLGMPDRLALGKVVPEAFRVVTDSGWTINLKLSVESDESFKMRRCRASELMPVHIPRGLSLTEAIEYSANAPAPDPGLSETDPWERCRVCLGDVISPSRTVELSGWDRTFVRAVVIRQEALTPSTAANAPVYVAVAAALEEVFRRISVPAVCVDRGELEPARSGAGSKSCIPCGDAAVEQKE